jgi:hypothetical protein
VYRDRARCPPLRDLLLQPGDLTLEIVEPQHERVDSARLDRSSPFPPVKDEAQLSRGVVLPPANPKQLDLELALIQSCLGLLPEGLQLLIQAIEKG